MLSFWENYLKREINGVSKDVPHRNVHVKQAYSASFIFSIAKEKEASARNDNAVNAHAKQVFLLHSIIISYSKRKRGISQE